MLAMSVATPPALASRDTSHRALQRQLALLLPDMPSGDEGGRFSLEAMTTAAEPPRLISAAVIEGSGVSAIPVTSPPAAGFAAFLDGTQESRVLRYSNGLPVIRGTVAAVVRVRTGGRMTTWRHRVAARVYAPLSLIAPQVVTALQSLQVELVDTAGTSVAPGAAAEHPYAVRDSAIHFAQRHREELEHELAAAWCEGPREPLFIDGGISNSAATATDARAIGVVKSHRTLYAEGAAMRTILALQRGERSSVFRVTSPKRQTVASWYLRLREWRGRDPMWGLVRVEIAEPSGAAGELAARADEVSRWILAEVTPVALPDPRWDRLVYGIHDCEEFLKAIT
jgi:hypothetical protein